MDDIYKMTPVTRPIRGAVSVPGSKSITNRALLLAAMARGESALTGVLFSDDSRGFMECLQELGYAIQIDEDKKKVTLRGGAPYANARIHVRSAGTSARFLTALLAAHKGTYFIDASAQMKARPMKPLLDALVALGCEIGYKEKEGFLPVILCGDSLQGGEIALASGQSSQFLSALLMTGCLYENGLTVRPIGKEIAASYVDMTLKMMGQFGVYGERKGDGAYTVAAGQHYEARPYTIEPDVSAACYFYAAAALTGGEVTVKGVYLDSMQGDIQFLDILQQLGCAVEETETGVRLTGPIGGVYPGIDVDMNDCSDQALTLAALAPFASSPTTIRNIQHIRHQESDRVHVMLTALSRMGIRCEETADGVKI
ncbi:MAG: 3-phosphoshikimate 1-carboxyvinyltransferase, partial [Oscillospiraceae bacterium]|nr:3-phosphoshikimate 1-carboxyvinyltransferase [Oscillospiraceae bacterium]